MAPAWGRRAAGGRVGGCCSSCRGVVSTEAAGVEGPIVMRNPRHAAAAGVAGPIKMRNPGTLLDVHVKQGGSFKQPLDKDFSGFAYVYTGEWGRVVPPPPPPPWVPSAPPSREGPWAGVPCASRSLRRLQRHGAACGAALTPMPARPAGSGSISGTEAQAQHALVFGAGDHVEASSSAAGGLSFLLIAGRPINEPIVQHGPFVMNTKEEIMKVRVRVGGWVGGWVRVRVRWVGGWVRVRVGGASLWFCVAGLAGLQASLQGRTPSAAAARSPLCRLLLTTRPASCRTRRTTCGRTSCRMDPLARELRSPLPRARMAKAG